jgi:hypothetical protein
MYMEEQNWHSCNVNSAEDKPCKTNEVRALDVQSNVCIVAVPNR